MPSYFLSHKDLDTRLGIDLLNLGTIILLGEEISTGGISGLALVQRSSFALAVTRRCPPPIGFVAPVELVLSFRVIVVIMLCHTLSELAINVRIFLSRTRSGILQKNCAFQTKCF